MSFSIPQGLRDLVAELFPGATIAAAEPLRPDAAPSGDATTKAAGYGQPVRLIVDDAAGERRTIVFRTAQPDDFGHDRRSDRAQGMLLAFDTFPAMPSHVGAIDVGVVRPDGTLQSQRGGGEPYLVTTWAAGTIYATDLRRVASEGVATPRDVERARALARCAAELHARPGDRPEGYARAIRDLIGHGEGIFGVVDNYPADVPAAPRRRLDAIERACVDWRHRLRGRASRLTRTHGDFHPFNVVFDAANRLTLLDASRGGQGDPADDVMAMAINYPFFALDRPASWPRGLGPLWRAFLAAYFEGRPDAGLYAAAPPFLAWRGLVLANPRFYPALAARDRDRLLSLVERSLAAPAFDPAWVEELFA